MATTTVEDLAKELKRTPAALLEQLQAAGINKTAAEDKLTEKDKTKLLEHLQVAHGSDTAARKKITLTKRETTEIRQADSAGKTRTVQVEVRKKRVLVKRDESAKDKPVAEIEKPAPTEASTATAPVSILDDAELAKREAEAKRKQKEILDTIAAGFNETQSGLRYQIIQKGNGKKAEKGSKVSVHYKGQLLDGTVFDSSYKRKEPIDFTLGIGQVISGWDEGIQLLKEGEAATLLIPSELGYGTRGAGGVIPPNAWLIFDVELVKVK